MILKTEGGRGFYRLKRHCARLTAFVGRVSTRLDGHVGLKPDLQGKCALHVDEHKPAGYAARPSFNPDGRILHGPVRHILTAQAAFRPDPGAPARPAGVAADVGSVTTCSWPVPRQMRSFPRCPPTTRQSDDLFVPRSVPRQAETSRWNRPITDRYASDVRQCWRS